MSRKKSRKIGQIGVPKSNEPRTISNKQKPKVRKGNKSGTRQQIAESQLNEAKKQKIDPRAGSKEPVDLAKYTGSQKQNTSPSRDMDKVEEKYSTPRQELEAIESDKALEALLEKQDSGKLSRAEQAYVSSKTARYAQLCELLGIEVDDYAHDLDQENEHEDDPFAKLDAIKLEDYKD